MQTEPRITTNNIYDLVSHPRKRERRRSLMSGLRPRLICQLASVKTQKMAKYYRVSQVKIFCDRDPQKFSPVKDGD